MIHHSHLYQNSNTSDDVSFNNVDISGIFKLNGIDISNRLNNLDTSFASLLQNSNTSDDVSFNNVDISGIFKLNEIDISNRLNNLDTSLAIFLIQNSNTSDDVSFNNLDISGILKGNISNNNTLSLGSHIIPTENAQYDLGSAEKK